ncbi:MAG: bifunctional fructose-bisphosphatase/inositol-phosphate phosphatase [Archaeoglobi archaeon]|nr:bifunctional fructose-bisphosphatase/inositol-phosphate phosphatase [Candidatus Mnemosynella bozhongmuii]
MNYLELCRKIRERVIEEISKKSFEELGRKVGTGAFGEKTSLIDRLAEKAVISELEERGISAAIISEETGDLQLGEGPPELEIILDPIDGTFNAVRGIPLYSLSIAIKSLSSNQRFGYVSSLATGEEFHAYEGKGAFRNSERIEVSSKEELEEANISLYTDERRPERVLNIVRSVNRIRSYGCASLEICYVACGALDAFVDLRGKQRIVDIAAASVILREAGGVVTDDRGMDLSSRREKISVVASNRKLHERILGLL